eukprot:TRINITY_DN3780_c0_g1_i1.p1 TRINITY_DN3780_c0_g1~~TRINITY_DN3780_c0_g1_i1.p1  ORF type:complete len:538 (+),score=136.60 TRINITY_DN3780_c0_g1_i1:226-1839(+)
MKEETEETSVSSTQAPSPSPARDFRASEKNLEAADRCLAAAAYTLNFDIAELWTFVPDPAGDHKAGGPPAVTPSCLYVYAQPATLENYRARLVGIWNNGEREKRHKLSPGLCERARESECPLWFTSKDHDTPLHADLPLNTAVVLPIRLESMRKDCCVVFFSTADVQRDRTALDFLVHIAKAAVLAISEDFGDHSDAKEDEEVVAKLNNVSVKLHPGEQLNMEVQWSELSEVEFLVNGSRCTIYTATYNHQACVVKLLRKDAVDAAIVRRELELEMELLMRLNNENIVRLLGAGIEPERFLIIERLDGGTLSQRCGSGGAVRDRRRRFKRKQPFNYLELLKCGRQIADGLRYLHDEAIPGRIVLHRDIKPDNIGFTKDGDAKLLDLGLAKAVPRSELQDQTFAMTGETGSTRYMAPEVAESRPYNEKVDVHSYGMVLWEMATLRKPYDGMARDQFYSAVVRGHVRPPLNKRWPKEFSDLLAACWAEDFKARPSFADVCNRLQEMLQEAADHHTPKTNPAKRGLLSKLGISDRSSAWF